MNTQPSAPIVSTDTPKVCVLIPAYRDQEGLLHTLNFLAQETYPFDIVVVDDGSPEPMKCDAFYGIHAVTLWRLKQNSGVEKALNAGLKLILERDYSYVARLDCGDLPLLGRFSRQVDFLDENPDVGIVGTWGRCIDDNGDFLFTLRFPTEHDKILRRQFYLPAMLAPSVMIRVEAFKQSGLYSDRHTYAEDYELYVRVGKSWRLANIPEPLTEYIISTSGMTAKTWKKGLRTRLRVQTDYFNWASPHAYLGVIRTLIQLQMPFSWGFAVKKRLWKD